MILQLRLYEFKTVFDVAYDGEIYDCCRRFGDSTKSEKVTWSLPRLVLKIIRIPKMLQQLQMAVFWCLRKG